MRSLRTKSLAAIVALLGSALMPLAASAHQIQGAVTVDCGVAQTVSVAVTNWSGNVEITKLPNPPGPVTERLPSSANSTVVFTIAEIGGNGSYTAGRQGNPTDPKPVSFTVDCAPPQLSVTKTADNDSVSAGSPIGFTITVHNSGGTATDVVLSDPLPGGPGISWSISPAVTGCAITGTNPSQTLTCSFGNLGGEATRSVHLVSDTQFTSCATYNNSAVVSADNQTTDVSSETASTRVDCPALTVTKVADDETVNAGSKIGFTITTTNAGPGMATNVMLSDPLPGGSGVDWSIDPGVTGCAITGTAPPQTLGCSFGDLAANDTRDVHVVSDTAFVSCADYNNVATVSGTNHPTLSSTQATTSVQCSDLSVTKVADAETVSAGSPIGFTITATNGGLGTATGVTLHDPLPGGSGLNWSIDPVVTGCAITGTAPTQTLDCTFGDIAGDSSKSVHVVSGTAFASCADYHNVATVDATNIAPPGEVPNPNLTATASTTVQCPDLSVTKTADAPSVAAGSAMGFTITASNAGPGTADNVTLNDPLPGGAGVSWSIDPSVTGCSITGTAPTQTLVCSFGDMAAGTSHLVHVTSGTSVASCAAYTNTATVGAGNQGTITSTAVTSTVVCPAGGTEGVSTGGVEAATAAQPFTGQADLGRGLMLALMLVVIGEALILAEAIAHRRRSTL